jgi:hypothetical protein
MWRKGDKISFSERGVGIFFIFKPKYSLDLMTALDFLHIRVRQAFDIIKSHKHV